MVLTLVSFFAALLGAVLLPESAFSGAATGLLSFCGILVAVILPTMALSVTALRASGRSPKTLEQYRAVLNKQFSFWSSFLGIVLVLAVAIIVGELLGWTGSEHKFTLWQFGEVVFKPFGLVNAVILFCITILLARAKPFVEGFRSLLNLHIDQVIEESSKEFQTRANNTLREIKSSERDVKFGGRIQR